MRRALLLFAIVLGLAALATSVSRPRDLNRGRSGGPATTAETPSAGERATATPPARLRFDTTEPRRRRQLRTGRPAVVIVETDEPGMVELDGLGLTAVAEPLTPARFDVLATQPTEASVRFTPAGADASEPAGRLSVSARGPARSGAPRARRTAPGR